MSATDKNTKLRTVELLTAVVATGAGSNFEIPSNKTFHIEGITTATVKVQCSNDGTNFFDMLTATADGGYESKTPWRFIRANVTAWTSGTITVTACYEDD